MKRKVAFFSITALLIIAIIGVRTCSRQDKELQREVTVLRGETLGTIYSVSIIGSVPEGVRVKLDSLFDDLTKSMSVYDPNSLLSRINRNETVQADKNIAYCINLSRTVSELSDGLYDITVQPLVAALGFSGGGAKYDANIDSLLQFVGYEKLSITDDYRISKPAGTQLVLNSIAKGAIVDIAADFLESLGVEEYLVDIGGEIFCRGANSNGNSWRAGIETPFEGNYSMTGEYIYTVLEVSNVGVATSGNYRNFYIDDEGQKVTHILNPKTGKSTSSNLLSATVIAENCALADAYGTMFIALGLEKSIELLNKTEIAALLIYANEKGDMTIYTSNPMKKYLAKR